MGHTPPSLRACQHALQPHSSRPPGTSAILPPHPPHRPTSAGCRTSSTSCTASASPFGDDLDETGVVVTPELSEGTAFTCAEGG